MEHLIVVRHGDNIHQNLSQWGKDQMILLAAKFGVRLPLPGRVRVLASPAGATFESAEILASAFGIEVETCGVLLVPPLNLAKVLDLVRFYQHEADTIVLVTHAACVELFPKCYGKEELRVDFPNLGRVPKGGAVVISRADKSVACI